MCDNFLIHGNLVVGSGEYYCAWNGARLNEYEYIFQFLFETREWKILLLRKWIKINHVGFQHQGHK